MDGANEAPRYTSYVAAGGDQGALVSEAMARQAPPGLSGIHVQARCCQCVKITALIPVCRKAATRCACLLNLERAIMKAVKTYTAKVDVGLAKIVFGVILMNTKMPEMNSYEASRLIRQRYLDNGPKIIAMTAYALEGDREKCLKMGMNDYRLHC